MFTVKNQSAAACRCCRFIKAERTGAVPLEHSWLFYLDWMDGVLADRDQPQHKWLVRKMNGVVLF